MATSLSQVGGGTHRSPLRNSKFAAAVRASSGYVISAVVVICLWIAVILVFRFPSYILPSPLDVLTELVKFWPILFAQSMVTLRETIVGFAIAIAIGIPVGAAISFSRIFSSIVNPILVSTQAVPKVALAPLFLIWFGFGNTTITVMATSVAVFPIIINTALGLNAMEPEMVRLGRVMGATPWRLLRRIRLPLAMPSIFAGLKLGITLALIGAVVGEFVASSSGLGYIANQAAGTLNTQLTFAALFLLSLLGIVLFALLELIERFTLRWHPSQTRFQNS